MPNSSRKTIFTTISIAKETEALVEKICKRYSLKKSEVVKLAFGYIDKAHINPSEVPESVKSELAKINKRQDDIIRFIRHYEEKELNPMIRATNSIALRFSPLCIPWSKPSAIFCVINLLIYLGKTSAILFFKLFIGDSPDQTQSQKHGLLHLLLLRKHLFFFRQSCGFSKYVIRSRPFWNLTLSTSDAAPMPKPR